MSVANISLQGKVAVVTGAKRGIGAEIAFTLARAGADVVVCTRAVADGQLAAVAKEIEQLGRRALAVQVDISRKADVDSMVKKVADEFGKIDILVNNAGIAGDRVVLMEVSEENYDRVLNTDLKGYFLCSQAAGRRMIEQGQGGAIVNVGSVLGVSFNEYSRMRTGLGVYAIAKAGVTMLTKALAFELGCHNIRVNAIAPTSVKTQMSAVWGNPEEEKRTSSFIPLGRVALTSDCAEAVLFLASDASSFITGDILMVDGGQLV